MARALSLAASQHAIRGQHFLLIQSSLPLLIQEGSKLFPSSPEKGQIGKRLIS